MSAPPIREPWKLDQTGKLVSMPWILWLQQLSTSVQTDGDVAALEGMMYNPSSSTAHNNDSEMLAWLSF